MVDRPSPDRVDLFGQPIEAPQPKVRLPKKLYRLVVIQAEGKPRAYGERTSGTFHSLPDMQYRVSDARRKGRTVRVFECEPEWKEIDVP